MGKFTSYFEPAVLSIVQQAERDDRIIRKWAETITPPTTGVTVLTNTAYNLEPKTITYVTEFFGNIESFSDTCAFYLWKCKGQNGSGAYEQITARFYFVSAVAGLGFVGQREYFFPAIPVKYSEGWRSIVIAAQALDITTVVTTSWAGYWERVEI